MKIRKLRRIQAGLFIISVILLAAGVFREEAGVVFIKAANICMECIGLG